MNKKEFVKLVCFLLTSYCINFRQAVAEENNFDSLGTEDWLYQVENDSKNSTGPCTSEEDCNYLGDCEEEDGEKYCNCIPGVSGSDCKIIDKCVNNPNMCGNDPDAFCGYHRNWKKVDCRCKSKNKRFDIPTKTCVERKPCQNQKQCSNGAQCINKRGEIKEGEDPAYCECEFGTSGNFCERVEECIENTNYCGDGPGVECRYNTYLKRAYCQCKDQNQRFDWPLKKCVDRKKCSSNEDCLPHGVCHNKCTSWEPCLDYDLIEEKKSCHCVEGTSGERCEVIDDCYNKIVDCGTSDEVACSYYYNSGLTAFTYCKCKNSSLTFDGHDKQCKVCDCGPTATSCSFKDGVRTCKCQKGSYNHGDRCEDCKCGEGSSGCNFKNGVKECFCEAGYKQVKGICEKCDCGSNSTDCSFEEDGRKVCKCEPGFTVGNYSVCAPICGEKPLKMCNNGGQCLRDTCMCLAGTGGPYCDIIYDCENKLCGENDGVYCHYDQLIQRAYCQCNNSHHVYDSYDKSCKVCNCGYSLGKDWQRCDFIQGQKVCQCSKGYAYNPKANGCTKCDCGSNSKACSFGEKGERLCQCLGGYIDYLGSCQKCNCGNNGICELKVLKVGQSASKVCKCDPGYQDNNGTCFKCDCGTNGKCSFNSNGKVLKCLCDSGFSENSGKCTFCDCGPKSKCSFLNKKKMCICVKGYKEDEGYCTDIDECLRAEACPGHGTLCENTLGSYKCRCQLGYQGRSPTESDKALCEKIAESETQPNYTPWKIGYGLVSVGFIVIIIGLCYIIFRLRKNLQTRT